MRTKIARFRHKVFVQRLGWELPGVSNGLESDQYDRADTLYITLRSAQDEVVGCARLLSTTGPYLLKDHFPQLLGSAHVPCSSKVWELSRLAADRPAGAGAGEFEWAIHRLLAETVRVAYEKGAHQLIGVTYASMERLFGRIGVKAHRVGPSERIDGRMVVASRIELDRTTLGALRIA
ncbi:acyl-homoserine-lactone synthase [Jeongeupia sp. USM3]|uniref:acyl-homoserine-lactone synthase n=1 Tax=Jeongeupia sp. USM3 TaxID=1906741 RepID=UPI00196A2D0C|nr:acyl-homoserine-lactone synthase [Jeongeupia sp. USM3]